MTSAMWFAIGSRKGKRHFEKCDTAEEHLNAAPSDIFAAWSPGIPTSLLLSGSSVAWPESSVGSLQLEPQTSWTAAEVSCFAVLDCLAALSLLLQTFLPLQST